MTASVLKQDPNTSKAQKNAIYQGKHNSANFWGNPLYQTTKWWEKKKKRKKKKRWKAKSLSVFVVFLSSAWKNTGLFFTI